MCMHTYKRACTHTTHLYIQKYIKKKEWANVNLVRSITVVTEALYPRRLPRSEEQGLPGPPVSLSLVTGHQSNSVYISMHTQAASVPAGHCREWRDGRWPADTASSVCIQCLQLETFPSGFEPVWCSWEITIRLGVNLTVQREGSPGQRAALISLLQHMG